MSVRKTTQKNCCKFFEVLLSHTLFKKWRKFLPQSTLIVKEYLLEIFVRFIKSVWHCCKPIYFLGKLNYIGVGNQQLKWFQSLISHRKQYTEYRGFKTKNSKTWSTTKHNSAIIDKVLSDFLCYSTISLHYQWKRTY